MAGWYHAQQQQHFYGAPSNYPPCCPPSSKRRKLEKTEELLYTTRLRRGPVTFRPYSDSLGNTSQALESRPERSRTRKSHLNLDCSPSILENGECSSSYRAERAPEELGTHVGHLFPEVLTLIFEYLDIQSKGRVARVCSRWRDAVYRKSVWRKVEARLHLNRPNTTLFPSLVKRGITRVQVLSLRKSLRELVNGIPNLESLNLSGCYNLSDSALDGAFNKDLPNIKRLNLSLCKEVNDNSLGRIATHCKNLEELDLGGCTKITNTGLLLVSWGLKNIKRLNLRSCRSISDHGLGHLSGLDSQPSESLLELGLQDCQKITDESLRHLSEGIPNLRKINLSFCVSVTDTGMKSLAKLGSLQSLNLRSCDNVSDIGIGFLAEGGNRPLTELDVSFCNNVSDASLKHVASGMSKLQSLSMTTCPVQNDGISRISKSLPGLRTLNVGQCISLTDVALESLSTHCHSLEKLDLYGCSKITSKGLESLKKCPKLANINLNL
ncbi:F-box/LRR-repeat protein 14 [Lepeophtheirus salmonis]|nr:F-box/LRR-repeat protein 14-like [Lepeophtheirus salmonis]